jgi:hypothetical protein
MIKTGQTGSVADILIVTTAGEALSTRDACYISTADGKAYKADGNDTTKLRFVGFAQEAANPNAAVNVVIDILTGFAGLTPGSTYYLSDTAGAISTTPGTYEILVGQALNATTILIHRGTRHASGTVTFTATGTSVITTGFRPSRVRIHAKSTNASVSDFGTSEGGWTVFGGNRCVYQHMKVGDGTPATAGVQASLAWYAFNDVTGTTSGHSGTVTTITATGFTLDNVEQAGPDVHIFWEAEGDI